MRLGSPNHKRGPKSKRNPKDKRIKEESIEKIEVFLKRKDEEMKRLREKLNPEKIRKNGDV